MRSVVGGIRRYNIQLIYRPKKLSEFIISNTEITEIHKEEVFIIIYINQSKHNFEYQLSSVLTKPIINRIFFLQTIQSFHFE